MTQHVLDQAREFLAKVLPWPLEGDEQAFVNIHTTYQRAGYDKPAWGGRACRSLDETVNAVNWLLKQSDTRDIYVAMSTQRQAQQRTGKNDYMYFKPIRNQAKAVALKSLFLDIDVKGRAGYPSIEEAVDALGAFLKAAALPRPSIIVASGGGLHVYWTMCRALAPHEWQPLANALAEATKKQGLKCDTQVTVDSARILRVPDTLNRKSDPPRPVRLFGKRLDFDYSVECIEKALEPYKVATPRTNGFILDPALFPPRPPLQGESDLSAGIDCADELPARDDVAGWCEAIIHSPDALHKLGDYHSWVSTLGFPLARLAKEQPQDEKFYRRLFLEVSAAAPNYDQAAAEEKWDDLYGTADQDREVKSSWRSLRHFARQHGYVDPLPELPIGLDEGKFITLRVRPGIHCVLQTSQ